MALAVGMRPTVPVPKEGGTAIERYCWRIQKVAKDTTKTMAFSTVGGEYGPPFMLRKVRTSLRKSNSPTVSEHGG